MARPKNVQPTYRLHRPSGRAYCDYYGLDGKRRTVCLGAWNSSESKREHARIISELAAGQSATRSDLTVVELLVHFMKHVATYYRRPDGTATSEVHGYKSVCRTLRLMYGHTIAAEFGIPALKAVRQRWIETGLSRRSINQMTWRVKKLMKWAAGEGHILPQVYQALQVVGGLQVGRSAARETEPVGPVASEVVAATLPHVSRPVAGMIRLQQATGMRPGEVVGVRICDIDRSGETWKYIPAANKMRYKGKKRSVFFGPNAQAVLAEFPTTDPTEFVFPSPKKLGHSYTVRGYSLAVYRACVKAGIVAWHPHQLRHSHATLVRDKFGLEAAQASLSHARAQMTEHYAEKSDRLAAEVARQIG